MRTEYGYSAADCDEMFDAEFFAYVQNLNFLEKRRASMLAASIAPLLGVKMSLG